MNRSKWANEKCVNLDCKYHNINTKKKRANNCDIFSHDCEGMCKVGFISGNIQRREHRTTNVRAIELTIKALENNTFYIPEIKHKCKSAFVNRVLHQHFGEKYNFYDYIQNAEIKNKAIDDLKNILNKG